MDPVATDESMLVEGLGERVCVEGDFANIKITHPQDLSSVGYYRTLVRGNENQPMQVDDIAFFAASTPVSMESVLPNSRPLIQPGHYNGYRMCGISCFENGVKATGIFFSGLSANGLADCGVMPMDFGSNVLVLMVSGVTSHNWLGPVLLNSSNPSWPATKITRLEPNFCIAGASLLAVLLSAHPIFGDSHLVGCTVDRVKLKIVR